MTPDEFFARHERAYVADSNVLRRLYGMDVPRIELSEAQRQTMWESQHMGTGEERVCRECSTMFRSPYGVAVYCSAECRMKARRRQWRGYKESR